MSLEQLPLSSHIFPSKVILFTFIFIAADHWNAPYIHSNNTEFHF